jgi:hypothetical protein
MAKVRRSNRDLKSPSHTGHGHDAQPANSPTIPQTGSARYFQRIENGAGTFTPAPATGGPGGGESSSSSRKRRASSARESDRSSKRARSEDESVSPLSGPALLSFEVEEVDEEIKSNPSTSGRVESPGERPPPQLNRYQRLLQEEAARYSAQEIIDLTQSAFPPRTPHPHELDNNRNWHFPRGPQHSYSTGDALEDDGAGHGLRNYEEYEREEQSRNDPRPQITGVHGNILDLYANKDGENDYDYDGGGEASNSPNKGATDNELAMTLAQQNEHAQGEDEEPIQPIRDQHDATFREAFRLGQEDVMAAAERDAREKIAALRKQANEKIAAAQRDTQERREEGLAKGREQGIIEGRALETQYRQAAVDFALQQQAQEHQEALAQAYETGRLQERTEELGRQHDNNFAARDQANRQGRHAEQARLEDRLDDAYEDGWQQGQENERGSMADALQEAYDQGWMAREREYFAELQESARKGPTRYPCTRKEVKSSSTRHNQ